MGLSLKHSSSPSQVTLTEAYPSRALLTQLAVDGRAGPYSNTTVLFLGSNDGTVLKVLPPGGPAGGREPVLLEEINAYSPSR